MTLRPLGFVIAAALAAPLPAQAGNYTYHGDLMDGDAPAEGAYDLRVRSFANPGAVKAMGEAMELPAVSLSGGRFNVELELPEDADGTTWVEVAVRKSGSGDDYVVLGDPQPVAKVNGTCPGAWALDGNAGAPAGSYLGFADARAVFINAPKGAAFNSLAEPATDIDLALRSKSGGDADTDLEFTTRNGKTAGTFVRDLNGNLVQYARTGGFEFFDGVPSATQNNGQETAFFTGRLRVGAVSAGAADTSGGVWFDDERQYASFVGRGDNQSNWTGIFDSVGGWRFTSHDNGAFGFNTGTEVLPSTHFKVNARFPMFNTGSYAPLGAENMIVGNGGNGTSTILMLLGQTGGKTAYSLMTLRLGQATDPAELTFGSYGPADLVSNRVLFEDRVGILRSNVANALEVGGNASKSVAGDWLANSDRRIKTGIAPIPNALDTIMKLRPVTFRYADDYRKSHGDIDDARYYNVIAQEFAEVFPGAVKGSGEYLPGTAKSKQNEILQVDTYPAQITAIAAIQELAISDDALREENARLHRQVDALAKRLERLESAAGR